ncbi:unnamed protein product [Closterium sp. Naga37s-1]|nr:unnamed protein product [Closterium sp. Naga37s-1]
MVAAASRSDMADASFSSHDLLPANATIAGTATTASPSSLALALVPSDVDTVLADAMLDTHVQDEPRSNDKGDDENPEVTGKAVVPLARVARPLRGSHVRKKAVVFKRGYRLPNPLPKDFSLPDLPANMAAELACAAIQLHDESAGQLLQKLQPKLMGPANVAGLLCDAAGAGGGGGERARGDEEEEEEEEKEEREEEEEEDLGGGMRAREENNDGTYRGEGEAALAVMKTLRTYEALRRHYVRVNELHLAAKAKLAALNRRRAGSGKGGKGRGGKGRGRGVEVGRGKKVGGKWRVAARAGVGSGKRGEKQGNDEEEEPEEENVERVAELLEEVMEKNLYNKRPDLSAGKTMRIQGLVINNEKARVIGHVPGVPVGFQFFSRQEMAVVGVNLQAQGGIDYSPSGANQWGVEVASCVVLSGGYEDDEDNGQWFDYTGQGGNNYRGDRTQLKDQQLERGNLALANSEKLKLPVRVVRGVKEPASYTKMVYTYDGLYRVVRSEHIPGDSGHMIFKFRMEREEGQPALQTPTVEFVRASLKTGTKSKDRRGVVAEDISQGKESRPVCAVNTVDKEPVPPPAFQYIRSMNHAEALRKLARREAAQAAAAGAGAGAGAGGGAAAAAAIDLQPAVLGCSCTDGCVDATACECAQLNGGMLPFTREGGLIEAQQIVYECGPQCACSCKAGFGNASSSGGGGGSACINRVSQKGVQVRLEVFKTENKGWGLRSWDAIPAGHFVCEYTGDLMRDDDAETLRGNDEYLFDLDLARGIQERWGDVSGILGGSRDGGGVGGGGGASAAAAGGGGGVAGGLDEEEEEEGEEGLEGGVRRESTRERKARIGEDRREEREEGREANRDRRGRSGGGRGGDDDGGGGGGGYGGGGEGDYGKRARGHDSSRHHRGSGASHETHESTRHHRGSDEPHGSTRHHRGSELPHESTRQHGRHGGSESGERSRDTRAPAAAAAAAAAASPPPATPAAAAAAPVPAAEAPHEDLHFCLDAKRMGNVARFINHSCNPNLFVQCVFFDHHDHRLPHIMLFAYDNIPPLKELTYDYGYQVDSVMDGNGNVKKLMCYCGAATCRKRLY